MYHGRAVWPNWRGDTVFCIATGASLTKEQLQFVRDRTHIVRVIAINDAGLETTSQRPYTASFADILYAADFAFWRTHHPATGALRVSAAQVQGNPCPVCEGLADLLVKLHPAPVPLNVAGRVWHGLHSGIQALQLAVTLGAEKVYLLGYDCVPRFGRTNYVDKAPGLNNGWHGERHDWAQKYSRIDWPIPIINCTPGSAIDAFPKLNIEEL